MADERRPKGPGNGGRRFLVFLALAGALALGLAVGAQLTGAGKGAGSRGQGDWPEFAPSAADRVILEGPAGVFALEHVAGAWTLRAPDRSGQPLADGAKVSALLDFLAMNRPIRRVDELSGPPEFTPRAAVTMDGWGRIEIGPDDGSGVGVFARVGGRPGYLVLSRDYVDLLRRGPLDYLDLALMGFDPDRAVWARLASMDEGWEIKLKGEEGFVFAAPENMVPARVRDEGFRLWLHELASLKAQDLAPLPPEDGRRPDLELAVRLRGGGERRLRLWRPLDGSGRWTAQSSRQGAYFLLDHERVEKLDRNAFSLVDRRLLTLDLGRVRALALSGGGRELRAELRDGAWRADDGTLLTGIDMRLWRLTDLQYEYGPVGALPASAKEAMRLDLSGDKGESVLQLAFYMDPGLPPGRCWAARSGERAFYPVDNQLLKDLQGQLPLAPRQAPAD